MAHMPTTTYSAAGVDTDREEDALKRLVKRIRPTWPAQRGSGHVALDVGYFANVIDIGGIGIAISADGVGTKVLIAQMMKKYDTVGIDCVAMNVNDLLCVGATPVSMVDYLALEDPDPHVVEAIAQGLAEGARQANISIPGGEMAQLRDVIKGYPGGLAFDLAGMAIGTVPLDKIIIGQDIREGDSVVGLESNGIHSNGLTLARKVFFEERHQGQLTVDFTPPAWRCSLGAELLKPTHIYVPEVLAILKENIPVKALMHITSDGFLNLPRVASPVGYIIEELPPIPPIFSLIKEYGKIGSAEMFRVFNMGTGFCVIVPEQHVERTVAIVEAHHKKAYRIGHAVADEQKRVYIKPYRLIGQGKRFWEVEG